MYGSVGVCGSTHRKFTTVDVTFEDGATKNIRIGQLDVVEESLESKFYRLPSHILQASYLDHFTNKKKLQLTEPGFSPKKTVQSPLGFATTLRQRGGGR